MECGGLIDQLSAIRKLSVDPCLRQVKFRLARDPAAAGGQFRASHIQPLRISSICGKESEDLAHHALALLRIKQKLSMRRAIQND